MAFPATRELRRRISLFTRRLFKLPQPPVSPSSHHADLPSFLAYAERIGLSPTSTTYLGTHYEYTILAALCRFGFSLHRIGGRADAGIDLLGTWHILAEARGNNGGISLSQARSCRFSRTHRAIPVFAQCKALKTKLGPNLVRELEGTFRYSPVGWRTRDKVGILVSPREATKGVRDAMARSAYPLVWMMMERDGTLRQAMWNGRVEELGLAALGTEVRYGLGPDAGSAALAASSSSDVAVAPAQRNMVVLTWNGDDLAHMDEVEDHLVRTEAEWMAAWDNTRQFSEEEKLELLKIVEDEYPDALPVGNVFQAGRNGIIQSLSHPDKERVLQLLLNRLEKRS